MRKFSEDKERSVLGFGKYSQLIEECIKDTIVDLIKKEGEIVASLQKSDDTYFPKIEVQGLIEIMASLTVEEVLHKLVQKKRKEEEDEEV